MNSGSPSGSRRPFSRSTRGISTPKLLSVILIVAGIAVSGSSFAVTGAAASGSPNLKYTLYAQSDIASSAYKVYGNPNLGIWAAKLVLTNTGRSPAYNLQITWYIENFAKSDPHVYDVLLPNSTVVDLFYPLLPANVTSLSTQTPSEVRFVATYSTSASSNGGQALQISGSKPVSILGGHDFVFSSIPQDQSLGTFADTFSNYPLIATFATVTDPVVQKYAAMANTLAGGPEASRSDQEAMTALQGIWDLSTYNGISYKAEPAAFWTGQQSQYLYYPRDVLQNHIGTCIDTSIFIATVAEALGMHAYIYLIPGHAFPVIQLPQSGNLVPIESTLLNYGVPFSEALSVGANQTWTEAMSGPYIPIDIEGLQSMGYTPPELPALPSDALTQWGYKMPTSQQQSGGSTQSGGTSGGTTGSTTATYNNPSPAFSLTYPSSWTVSQQQDQVTFVSQQQNTVFLVAYAQGLSAQQIQANLEAYIGQGGTLTAQSTSSASVSGVQATVVVYSFQDAQSGTNYDIVARYMAYQGTAYVIAYQVPSGSSAQSLVNICEGVVGTFTFQ